LNLLPPLLSIALLGVLPVTAAPATPPIKGADLNLLESVRVIGGQVEKLRGERFARPPLAVRASEDMRDVAAEIRAFNVIDRDRLAARGRAWADVGLGGPASPAVLFRLLAADLQGIGFDPAGNRLLVDPDRLTDKDFSPEEEGSSTVLMHAGIRPDEPLVGHLLIHVRQRERLGADYLAGTTDRLLAQAAWAEGEANLLAVRYLFGAMGLADDVIVYGVDPGQFLDGGLVPRDLDRLSGVEADLVRFVYHEGYAQAVRAYRTGGWSGVSRAMQLSHTTRAVLHPDRAALPEAPFVQAVAPVEGLRLVDSDSLGEQSVFVLVSRGTGKDNLALQAADGWVGDQLYRWEPGADTALRGGVTEWITNWASSEDVEDFVYSLGRVLGTWYPDATPRQIAPGTDLFDVGERLYRIERQAETVRVLVIAAELAEHFPPPAAAEVAPPDASR